jgi:predicted transcriptional regulator
MTETLTIRLDRAEKRAVQKLAGKEGASRWVRRLIRAQLCLPSPGFLARHEQWLATQNKVVDSSVVLDWFRKKPAMRSLKGAVRSGGRQSAAFVKSHLFILEFPSAAPLTCATFFAT